MIVEFIDRAAQIKSSSYQYAALRPASTLPAEGALPTDNEHTRDTHADVFHVRAHCTAQDPPLTPPPSLAQPRLTPTMCSSQTFFRSSESELPSDSVSAVTLRVKPLLLR